MCTPKRTLQEAAESKCVCEVDGLFLSLNTIYPYLIRFIFDLRFILANSLWIFTCVKFFVALVESN